MEGMVYATRAKIFGSQVSTHFVDRRILHLAVLFLLSELIGQ